MSVFQPTIDSIVFRSSQEQVGGVHALSDITSVQNLHILWDVAIEYFKRCSVRRSVRLLQPKLAIASIIGSGSMPNPTIKVTEYCDFLHKPIHGVCAHRRQELYHITPFGV
jgi:hypothetical protein